MTNVYKTKENDGTEQVSRVPSNEVKRARFSLCGRRSKEVDRPQIGMLANDVPEGPVIEVTERNFHEKVINTEKDVLIQFYTMVPSLLSLI